MEMFGETEQATTDQAEKDKFISHFSTVFNRLSVVLWFDEGDFPENLHIVCPCHNK